MNNEIKVAFICDENYVVPTLVAISSLIKAKKATTGYHVYLIARDATEQSLEKIRALEEPTVKIEILQETVPMPNMPMRFFLPKILAELDKVLYLDSDIVVQDDLQELYDTPLEDCYVAAVAEFDKKAVQLAKSKKAPFNCGVMLLNLARMRADGADVKLPETQAELNCGFDQAMNEMLHGLTKMRRKEATKKLLDSCTEVTPSGVDAFNVVCAGKVHYLPLRWNFMPLVLDRDAAQWAVNTLNELYETEYDSRRDAFADAAILHYCGREKPWENPDGPCSAEWRAAYLAAPLEHELVRAEPIAEPYALSVIMPCYNVEKYIEETLESVFAQSFTNFEMICLDDGSSDRTPELLKQFAESHPNMRVIQNENHHQGWERNRGIELATGKYVYYMDSDDLLADRNFERIVSCAEQNNLDLLFFEATSFFENDELEKTQAHYKTLYTRKNMFLRVYKGEELFRGFYRYGGLIVQPCQQLVRRSLLMEKNIRFPEIDKHEDNAYTAEVLLAAERVKCLCDPLFYRRVRSNSVMTQEVNAIVEVDSIAALVERQLELAQTRCDDEELRLALIERAVRLGAVAQAAMEQSPTEEPACRDILNERLRADVLFLAMVFWNGNTKEHKKLAEERARADALQKAVEWNANNRERWKATAMDRKEQLDKLRPELADQKRQNAELKTQLARQKEQTMQFQMQLARQKERTAQFQTQLARQKEQTMQFQKQSAARYKELHSLYCSGSYRIGRAVTWLPRKVKKLLRKILGR